MAEFQSQVDVGNRALQHCGVARMGLDGFSENSRGAGEVSACYGKLRQAELRNNVWTFACRRAMLRAIDNNAMLLDAALWVGTTTYFVGSIVSDANGVPWISRIPNNLGLQPSVVPSAWEPYFGPLTASLWTSGTTYFAGELVYTTAGTGVARVYVSLQSGNQDNPASATAWDATATYQKNDVITYLSVAYMSLIDLNLNQTPSAAPAAWNSGTTYGAAATVCGSDGVIYSSIAGGNLGNNPVTDGGIHWTNTGVLCPWTTVFVSGKGSTKWRQIGGPEFPMGVGVKTLDIIYPLDTGPVTQSFTRNVYVLPAGYLRIAGQWPGTGITAPLGGPMGLIYRDWAFEGGFLTSADAGPIALRFVADVQDVSRFDPMFCEGLAARIGMEVCEPLTQSNTQVATVAKIYDEWMDRAKLQNAIEQGSDEAPDDDWIAVRA